MSQIPVYNSEPIIALATPAGMGAIAVIRISGEGSIARTDAFFQAKNSGKKLVDQKSHTLHLGYLKEENRIIDEVLVSIFKDPNSYTGEEVVEISCHGSVYIQQEILQLFIKNGIRHARPGEFTLRAFLNGKMDLSQAEAVADLIASDSSASHQIALQQMRGGFSNEIADLRQELLNFASLIELELDFSEEDVEFADRSEFKALIAKISAVLKRLIDSFALGNVLKNGIPVAIVGEPNVGKSTLLNALLNEEKAIVSSIAGTTRDAIEDEIAIGGIVFRFIDTAGIRETRDEIESVGIRRTFEKIEQAQLIIYLIDVSALTEKSIDRHQLEIDKIKNAAPDKKFVVVLNKIDTIDAGAQNAIRKSLLNSGNRVIPISAKEKLGLDELTKELLLMVNSGELSNNQTIVSNSRHFEALNLALRSVEEISEGMNAGISSDLIAIDIRQALFHLGEITGQITTDDLLGNIFANFCIGK